MHCVIELGSLSNQGPDVLTSVFAHTGAPQRDPPREEAFDKISLKDGGGLAALKSDASSISSRFEDCAGALSLAASTRGAIREPADLIGKRSGAMPRLLRLVGITTTVLMSTLAHGSS